MRVPDLGNGPAFSRGLRKVLVRVRRIDGGGLPTCFVMGKEAVIVIQAGKLVNDQH